LGDYKEAQVGNGRSLWVKRSVDYEPLPAVWINSIFDNLTQSLELSGDDKIAGVKKKRDRHEDFQCITVESRQTRTLCFDSAGNLESADLGPLELNYTYSDYRQVGSKWAPFRVEARRGDRLLLEGTLTLASQDAAAEAVLLRPPTGAIERTNCSKYQGGTLHHRVQPDYPAGARQAHEQGTVILYAVILKDGSLQNVTVIQTAGAELDNSALAAVRQWRFDPITCGNAAIEKETLLTVNYSLQH
jgi:TonB family protein